MSGSYDAIVVGLGGMGSAAAYHLARRGWRVLGLDAHARGHALGASHGRSRIIRQAYYQAPEYVPLVLRSFELWRELEAESGRRLLTVTGCLLVDRPDGKMARGAAASGQKFGLPYEVLNADEVAARFPGFRLPADLVGVYEPGAGALAPETAVAAHLDLAARHGATLRHEEPVRRWAADGAGARVVTDRDEYRAERLVIAAGAWADDLLGELGLPLTVRRVVNVHFQPERPDLFAADNCPIHIWEIAEGHYYGLPDLPGQGLKFGRHDGNEPCTAHTVRREVDAGEIEQLRRVLDRYLPGAAGPVRETLTCLYVMTPDNHFVLDRHPRHPAVSFVCGCSGHGFKFTPVIGEILADLTMEGVTDHPIDFLAAARFATPAAALAPA